jgi:dTDP-4-amino-4,6-dideoxygalactose transaminase
MKIPFNRPCFQGNEIKNIQMAIEASKISGDGMFTKKCHTLFEEALGVTKALLTTSCTDALEMSSLLLDLKPGDEVIVPSFTFVSTANAFALRGIKPIFADIRPDTLNIDENKIEALITEKTRAIIPVHYAGVACEMDKILTIAKKHKIAVVEDNAHGLFGKYKGKFLGTFGELATLSFHETKNFICGEGGALLINDKSLVERAEIIREKGTNRSRFFRGEVDKYSWVDLGSSYLPSEILAAFLYAQLQEREKIQSKRSEIWNYYNNNLQNWALEQNIRLPTVPADCEQAYHMYYMIFPTLKERTSFIDFLKTEDIHAVFHYLPLHLSDMGKKFGGTVGQCPITEDLSDRIVRLPFFNDMTDKEQAQVVNTIHKYKVARSLVKAEPLTLHYVSE